MRILSLVHGPAGRPGTFGDVVIEAGHELDERSFTLGSPPEHADAYDAAVVFGGSMHIDQERNHPWLLEEKRFLAALVERDVPVFGVCLGAQLLASTAGATVERADEPEIGWYEVELSPNARDDPLFATAPDRFAAFQWHSYRFDLPPGAVPLAHNPRCLQAFRLGERAWGIQFHAEVTREMVTDWISNHGTDADAVRVGFDPARALLRLESEIERWMRFGAGLIHAFLAVAADGARPRALPAEA